MCFFNSLTADVVAVAKKYGKQTDIIEAVRKILAEKERYERAAQAADPNHKTDIYSIRLTEGMYSIPAYAEPHCVIVSGSDQLKAMQWGLIPRSANLESRDHATNMVAHPVRSKFNNDNPYDPTKIEEAHSNDTHIKLKLEKKNVLYLCAIT